MSSRCYVYFIAFFLSFPIFAQNEAYTKGVYVDKQKNSMLYRFLEPKKMEKGKKYPLVLFLHGAGERGNDNESQLRNGGTVFTNPVHREKYPCFVLFPQCPDDAYWSLEKRPAQGYKNGNPLPKEVPITKHLQLVKDLLDETMTKYPIDPKRVYIMGISMGAIATLDMVYRFPDTFAKAVSICGATNIERMREFKGKTQFRFYHGDIDDVIPVTYSREAYKALKTTGKKAEYIEFYGANHNAWHPAFNTPDFLQWTFKKK
ncbi:phospholipase [Capnocytophaga sp. HP1101]